MAAPLANPARPIFYETDVTPSAGLKPDDAYDLHLYSELGKSGRGVLVVTMVLQFQFGDGESTAAATKGRPLVWKRSEKEEFARYFKEACLDVWNHRFRIKTTSPLPAIRDVGVVFNLKSLIDGWHTSDHWELGVTKVDGWTGSSVNIVFGNATIDSKDINYAEKARLPKTALSPGRSFYQRGAAHEFGHMLGLRDEYKDANSNLSHQGDWDSIMHSGEEVRQRHYAPFAHWLSRQHSTLAIQNRKPIVYWVDGPSGPVNLSNAYL